jgi:hypothetical protein
MGLGLDGRGLLPLTSPEEAGGLAHMAVLVTPSASCSGTRASSASVSSG